MKSYIFRRFLLATVPTHIICLTNWKKWTWKMWRLPMEAARKKRKKSQRKKSDRNHLKISRIEELEDFIPSVPKWKYTLWTHFLYSMDRLNKCYEYSRICFMILESDHRLPISIDTSYCKWTQSRMPNNVITLLLLQIDFIEVVTIYMLLWVPLLRTDSYTTWLFVTTVEDFWRFANWQHLFLLKSVGSCMMQP